MPNELKRKLRDITVEQLGQQPKLKKVRLQCALLLRGVQFNTTHNLDALRQELLVSLGAAAGRLEKVPKQIDASVECAFWGARADPCQTLVNGRGAGGGEHKKNEFACQTWAEREHRVCVLFRAERLFQRNSRRAQGHAQHAAHS